MRLGTGEEGAAPRHGEEIDSALAACSMLRPCFLRPPNCRGIERFVARQDNMVSHLILSDDQLLFREALRSCEADGLEARAETRQRCTLHVLALLGSMAGLYFPGLVSHASTGKGIDSAPCTLPVPASQEQPRRTSMPKCLCNCASLEARTSMGFRRLCRIDPATARSHDMDNAADHTTVIDPGNASHLCSAATTETARTALHSTRTRSNPRCCCRRA